MPALPPRIGRLYELASNLWWSWHENGRQVFRSLDYALWRTSGHNPVKELRQMTPDQFQTAARDPAFLELYDSVMREFDTDLRGDRTWFPTAGLRELTGPVAYFSAEFAIHSSLPMYAGGLGVLAGDICKEASDLGLPMVGVGFMYPQGYFHQRISAEGWQEEVYSQLNFAEAPITPYAWPKNQPLIKVRLAEREVRVSVWQVKVGRVNLFLLDTNVEPNTPQDRMLSARLYTAEPEQRMQQVIVLGTGGVRALRALGINPAVWHANEDHTAFMMLERIREEIDMGMTLEQAAATVRANTIFTTHTPVPAGHNTFSTQLMDRYFHSYWESLELNREEFLRLGQHDGLGADRFSLSALALRLSSQCNAVSRLHGQVARRMWHVLWPKLKENDVPISHITNGVHLPTWQAPELTELCTRHLGNDLAERHGEEEFWKCIPDVPDEEFWDVRQVLKSRLIRSIQERAQQRWVGEGASTQQVLAMGTLLDPYALTIAFSRRFAEYKRPALILSDIERLKKLVNNPTRPVQIIFAGKSHPADFPGKHLLRQVFLQATDRSFQGRLCFVEDYDMHLARDLVRGADVWLNNPRRMQEASGTSGMKAAMNGVLHLSVRDGWWEEAYDGSNGWSIDGAPGGDGDGADAEALYRLLEDVIVPMYYDRDRRGVPHRWVEISKKSIKSIAPRSSAQRMVKEYTLKMYAPSARARGQ